MGRSAITATTTDGALRKKGTRERPRDVGARVASSARASGVVNDLLMQRRTQTNGHYSGPRYVSVD